MSIQSTFLGVAVAALALAGCHGSSSGSLSGVDDTDSPSTAAFGTVAAFGSVVVNGVRYATSQTQFTIDGAIGTEGDLSVGDVVLVKGTLNTGRLTGVATSVDFDDNVQGPVTAVDPAADTLLVLGQTVQVGVDTSFDDSIQPPSLAGLAVGNVVEVSGLVASDGSILATRIEPKPAGGELEITGVVASHDGVARRFNINAQVVDYSAAQLVDFPTGAIANGQLVEVKGSNVVSGVLRVTRVEHRSRPLGGAAGERREVEGLITRFVSPADFDVAGLPVATNGQTVFTGGVPAELGLNVKVAAEGGLNASGVLVATRIDIRRSAAVRVVGFVDSANAAAGSFVVLGITVKVDALTRMEDKGPLEVRRFSLINLSVNDYVEVRGAPWPPGSGEVLAALVERHAPATRTELQGFVQTVAEPLFSILGVQVSTNAGTDFADGNGVPLTSIQFFSQLSVGDLVKATGLEVGSQALQADEAELAD